VCVHDERLARPNEARAFTGQLSGNQVKVHITDRASSAVAVVTERRMPVYSAQAPTRELQPREMRSEPTSRSVPRPLTTGAVLAAVSRLSATVAGVATTVALARLLGPHGWGGFYVAQSLVAVLLATSTLGVEHGIAYFVSSGRWDARRAFDTAVKLAAATGSLGAAIAVGVRVLAPGAFAGLPLWPTSVAAVALPFALVWLYASYVALATDRYELWMAMPALQAVLTLLLSVGGAILFQRDGAIAGTTLATFLVALTATVWARRRLSPSSSHESGSLRRAVSFGIKGYLANALQLLNYRLDIFILSAFVSAASVGRYSLAVAVTSLMWVLPRALSDVLFPRVARLSAGDESSTREMVERKGLRHVSLIVLVTAGGLAASLELLVVPIFGASYTQTVNLGLILLPGAAAIGIASVLGATVVGRGKPIYSLYGALVTTPLTIALYATLIPWLKADGAALASTLSYLTGFVLLSWFYRRTTGRRVLPLLIPTSAELSDLRAIPHAVLGRAGGHAR
jgi:stage V sporulation protein B